MTAHKILPPEEAANATKSSTPEPHESSANSNSPENLLGMDRPSSTATTVNTTPNSSPIPFSDSSPSPTNKIFTNEIAALQTISSPVAQTPFEVKHLRIKPKRKMIESEQSKVEHYNKLLTNKLCNDLKNLEHASNLSEKNKFLLLINSQAFNTREDTQILINKLINFENLLYKLDSKRRKEILKIRYAEAFKALKSDATTDCLLDQINQIKSANKALTTLESFKTLQQTKVENTSVIIEFDSTAKKLHTNIYNAACNLAYEILEKPQVKLTKFNSIMNMTTTVVKGKFNQEKKIVTRNILGNLQNEAKILKNKKDIDANQALQYKLESQHRKYQTSEITFRKNYENLTKEIKKPITEESSAWKKFKGTVSLFLSVVCIPTFIGFYTFAKTGIQLFFSANRENKLKEQVSELFHNPKVDESTFKPISKYK